jgi:hypothetical protein
MRIYIFIFFISLLIFSCEPQYKHESGELPSTPQNLADFNSSHDDYNSTAPTLGSFIPLCFSTNRYSNGNQFDVIYEPMVVSFGKNTGIFRILNSYAGWGDYQYYNEILNDALNIINTSGNELGPYLMVNRTIAYQGYEFLFLYATDAGGNFDIRFTFKRQQDSVFIESIPIEYINSEFDDLYPCVDFEKSKFYFCSNRENERFDIYTIDIIDPYYNLIEEFLYANQKIIVKNNILSSEYDDKCPYIFNNMLVFVSNRPGGYGGYDLYFSTFENDQWRIPENFGSDINSQYDEYRPILINEGVDFEKNMMVFSSNRKGGKGGYDLYYAGSKKEY